MPRLMTQLVTVLLAAMTLAAGIASAEETFVRLTTDEGEILLQMNSELAPNHVANFTFLCRSGFYDGTAFHRVIPGFMIQGGDPNSKDDDRSDDGMGGPTLADVLGAEDAALVEQVNARLEASGYAPLQAQAQLRAEFNEGSHVRGTLSMARSQNPDSAGSQFFICVADTPHLDGKYTVFGRVVGGLEVVDIIVAAERDRRDNPLQTIRLHKAEVLEGVDSLSADEREALAADDAVDATVE